MVSVDKGNYIHLSSSSSSSSSSSQPVTTGIRVLPDHQLPHFFCGMLQTDQTNILVLPPHGPVQPIRVPFQTPTATTHRSVTIFMNESESKRVQRRRQQNVHPGLGPVRGIPLPS